ncbi:hypothetical protein ACFV6U_40160, partial [Streptomyces sp. NPDC059810]|uniref:hypothetical protein n=1 Tax=Streptomyces sp. NPDC059810 TaxID=3346956 RepID=UPI003668B68F
MRRTDFRLDLGEHPVECLAVGARRRITYEHARQTPCQRPGPQGRRHLLAEDGRARGQGAVSYT